MKTIIINLLFLTCIFISKKTNGQEVLYDQKGVSFSFSASYVNTIQCGDEYFDQYKVQAVLTNNTGYTIETGYCEIVPKAYPGTAACGLTSDRAALNSGRLDNSSSAYSYCYALVPKGEAFSTPAWSVGSWRTLNK